MSRVIGWGMALGAAGLLATVMAVSLEKWRGSWRQVEVYEERLAAAAERLQDARAELDSAEAYLERVQRDAETLEHAMRDRLGWVREQEVLVRFAGEE